MDFIFRPIQQWPRKMTTARKRSPFGVTYAKTFQDLEREMKHLDARIPIIQLALTDSEIRLDGKPRAGATPSHPGAIVTFEKGKSTMNFPCDAFTDWIGNLRAVSLALEALRRIDRYGVVATDEQYRGWAQLPPAQPVDEARKWAARLSMLGLGSTASTESILTTREAYDIAYRAAVKLYHPDAAQAIRPEWHEIQQAAKVLSAHHGCA